MFWRASISTVSKDRELKFSPRCSQARELRFCNTCEGINRRLQYQKVEFSEKERFLPFSKHYSDEWRKFPEVWYSGKVYRNTLNKKALKAFEKSKKSLNWRVQKLTKTDISNILMFHDVLRIAPKDAPSHKEHIGEKFGEIGSQGVELRLF